MHFQDGWESVSRDVRKGLSCTATVSLPIQKIVNFQEKHLQHLSFQHIHDKNFQDYPEW